MRSRVRVPELIYLMPKRETGRGRNFAEYNPIMPYWKIILGAQRSSRSVYATVQIHANSRQDDKACQYSDVTIIPIAIALTLTTHLKYYMAHLHISNDI